MLPELCQFSLPCLSSPRSPQGGIWPCRSTRSRPRYLLRVSQKRISGTWDGLGHGHDLPSSAEDGALQAGLPHADLRCKGTAVSSWRGNEGAFVPKGTPETLGPCWQDLAMPWESPPSQMREFPRCHFWYKEHLRDIERQNQATAQPASALGELSPPWTGHGAGLAPVPAAR